MVIHVIDDDKDISIATDGRNWTITEHTNEGLRISVLKNYVDTISKKED